MINYFPFGDYSGNLIETIGRFPRGKQEANDNGFEIEHLQIALSLCGDRQPVSWLQDNWVNMIDTVVTLATNYGQEARPENDIGTLSRNEASNALVRNLGNIWSSVTECVEERRRKFAELMIRSKGHFSGHDIITALTASGGDADEAFIELSRPPDQKASGAFSGMQMNETATESNSADEKIFPTYETDVHAFLEPQKTGN